MADQKAPILTTDVEARRSSTDLLSAALEAESEAHREHREALSMLEERIDKRDAGELGSAEIAYNLVESAEHRVSESYEYWKKMNSEREAIERGLPADNT